MRLNNKVILITGSYTGIGLAIAKACVNEGAKVIVNGLEDEQQKMVLSELGTKNAVAITADIAESGSPELLVKTAIDAFGQLDAVVNNAAMVPPSTLESTSTELLHKVMAVNAIAPLAIIQSALPHLIAVQGCVLNIGSINAWGGEPGLLAYSMSKGALMTMTRNIGDSLFRDKGVRVNQINPGWVLTEREVADKREQGMVEDWYKDLPNIFAPAQRIFSPKEIAALAIFLLSDECGPVSGQVMDLEQFPMIGRNLPKEWDGSHDFSWSKRTED